MAMLIALKRSAHAELMSAVETAQAASEPE